MYENYFSAAHPRACGLFTHCFQEWRTNAAHDRELLILCIGTDRVTGDSLGPLIGQKLKPHTERLQQKNIYVAGTLEHPIHAVNLSEEYHKLMCEHPDAAVVAVDAGVGSREQIGMLSLREGAILPGIALHKSLPAIGDFSITGIVGLSGPDVLQQLKQTPRAFISRMADVVAECICQAI
ncbi:MAG: spore protease YyaC [Lachnospiraceae bacterium]|nr:spore protease YyaC [Lachnospiraceae bacterium]